MLAAWLLLVWAVLLAVTGCGGQSTSCLQKHTEYSLFVWSRVCTDPTLPHSGMAIKLSPVAPLSIRMLVSAASCQSRCTAASCVPPSCSCTLHCTCPPPQAGVDKPQTLSPGFGSFSRVQEWSLVQVPHHAASLPTCMSVRQPSVMRGAPVVGSLLMPMGKAS